MRVSHNWLRELLPGLNLSAREVSHSLTSLGLEVEGVTEHGLGLDAVRVVRVVAIEPHPKRDKLQLVTVDLGGGKTQRVVCGASNVPAPGGLVVLAPLGTHLPAVNLTLTPREIGGVVSEGMLCSETELGLADQSQGIVVLPAGSSEPGTPLLSAFPEVRDTVYELGITPNRPDALGHLGVARDLGALHELQLRLPTQNQAPQPTLDIANSLTIDLREPERCPRYGAALVRGVKVRPSPAAVRWRLHRLGVRPISNVVDVTNWLLLEFGHPMHAFDLATVHGGRIVIRRATAGEPFTTLDGQARELSDDDLMICDGKGPVALAGVMGGANTEIRDTSNDVLLECAYFNPTGIRRASRRHALHTESSHRFERGVNWGGIAEVLERAKSLLCQFAEATAVSANLIATGASLEVPTISLRAAQLQRLLGISVPLPKAVGVLQRLGFRVVASAETEARLEAPSHRPDVNLEADLIEEVARVIGYDQIPSALPRIAPGAARTTGKLERGARHAAASLGLFEAVSHAFIAPSSLQKLGLPMAAVVLSNPLSDEKSVMRTSLLPGLLEATARAQRHGEAAVRLFEVGAVFLAPSSAPRSPAAEHARPAQAEDRGVVPDERPTFATLLAGQRPMHLDKPQVLDLYDAKAIALGMIGRLTGKTAQISALPESDPRARYLHPRGRARLELEGRDLGVFGAVHPNTLDAFDVAGPALLVELALSEVEALAQAIAKYRPIPRLPAVTRDVALEVPSQITAAEIERVLLETGGELCESVALFDLFEGGSVKAGHRSLAFHVVYRDPKAARDPEHARTLTDQEVDTQHQKLVQAVTEKFGAQLRT
jgi:phenylalanyl-tRNA synthetase beta chain